MGQKLSVAIVSTNTEKYEHAKLAPLKVNSSFAVKVAVVTLHVVTD